MTAGPVVWLTASVDTILERLAADPATASRRPNLTTAGGREEIEALLATRTPIYRECATLDRGYGRQDRGGSGRRDCDAVMSSALARPVAPIAQAGVACRLVARGMDF